MAHMVRASLPALCCSECPGFGPTLAINVVSVHFTFIVTVPSVILCTDHGGMDSANKSCNVYRNFVCFDI